MKQQIFKTYSVKVQQHNINTSNTDVHFYLSFPEKSRNVFEEVLIFDGIGLLSSLGGALGLFIGFSFFGCIVSITDYFVDKGFMEVLKRY